MQLKVPLVLASASPRRRLLLERLGVSFTVHPSHIDETAPVGTPPEKLVQMLAERKANAIAGEYSEALVLGADTVVWLDGTLLEKPSDQEEAADMLRRLSGRMHTVYTGITLVASARTSTACEATEVTFAELKPEEIDAYVATGAPLDKAGAYGIQDDLGALFVSRIEGDYYNVVGLPLHRLYTILREDFGDLLAV